MIKNIINILFLLLTSKCQNWWDEVNGHLIDDSNYGFAGSFGHLFTDFYLCSERKYRIHYLNDETNNWSQEFTACQPVGNCKQYIDGIAISGGKRYCVRANNISYELWQKEKTGYNISNNDGFGGKYGQAIDGIYIYGDDYYRSGHYFIKCSNEKEVAKNVTYDIFRANISNIEYIETSIYNNKNNNITVQLLNLSKINFKGSITIKIEKNKTIDSDWGGLIGNNIKNLLKKSIDININDLKNSFEKLFCKNMANGNIAINFIWSQRKIEIDTSTKILPDNYSYRGGFRINIYLNENSELLSKIKIICEIFLKYCGKKSILSIKELLSDFNSYDKLDIIMNELGIYSNMAEGVILLKILSQML